MNMELFLPLLLALALGVSEALVVTQPCCYEFHHRVSLFGALLPLKDELTIFRSKLAVDYVEGVLKDTPTADPILCDNHIADSVPPMYFLDTIALIPRGGCSFAKKVYYAQRAGAKAAVVYQAALTPGVDDNSEIGMAGDEEYAPKVLIPSAFISHATWVELREINNGSVGITIVLNETGAIGNEGVDSMPMMWNSLMFLFRVFLIIWSFLGCVFVYNWLKNKIRKRKRFDVVRNLPSCRFSELKDKGEVADFVSGVNKKTASRKLKKKDYIEVEQNENVRETEMQEITSKETTTSTASAKTTEENTTGSDETVLVEIALKDEADQSDSSVLKNMFDCIETDNCVICLCDYEPQDVITVLPCRHVYHKDCIEPWLISKSALCPMCKQSILPDGDARSLNEITSETTADDAFHSQEDQRRTSVGLTLGMFLVIVMSLSFTMFDNSD